MRMSKVWLVLLLSVSLRADVIFDSFVGTVTSLDSTNSTLSNGVYNTTVGSTIYGTISFDPFLAGTTTLIPPTGNAAFEPETITVGSPPLVSTQGTGTIQQPFPGTLYLAGLVDLVDGAFNISLNFQYSDLNAGLYDLYNNEALSLANSSGYIVTSSYATPPPSPTPIPNPPVVLDSLSFSIISVSPISTGSPTPPTNPTPPPSNPSSTPEPATLVLVALPILAIGISRKFIKR